LLPGLFPHDVVGVPVRPVRIVGAGPLLMLAMGDGGAPEAGGKIGLRGECRLVCTDASGQPLGDLLDQPDIPVGIIELRERAVTGPLRIRTFDATVRTTVNHFAHIDTALGEISPCRLDVVDDERPHRRDARTF
jgi:hypothetical protein